MVFQDSWQSCEPFRKRSIGFIALLATALLTGKVQDSVVKRVQGSLSFRPLAPDAAAQQPRKAIAAQSEECAIYAGKK
jgi:hypothetical protein